MTHRDKHAGLLRHQAVDSDLVSQLTTDRDTRLRNEARAADLRRRIAVLNQRLAKLASDYPPNSERLTNAKTTERTVV